MVKLNFFIDNYKIDFIREKGYIRYLKIIYTIFTFKDSGLHELF